MKKDYSRKVEVICPLCGGKKFRCEDKNNHTSTYKCINCDRIFNIDELFSAKQKNFSAHRNKLEKKAKQDWTKDYKKMLKKTFGNNKYFKIK